MESPKASTSYTEETREGVNPSGSVVARSASCQGENPAKVESEPALVSSTLTPTLHP